MATEPAIMVVEGPWGTSAPKWRQYFVITDERCAVVEMVPAMLGGWRFNRVFVQGSSDWPGYSRDAIVAFKHAHPNSPGPTLAPDLGAFRAKLIAVAASGRLPKVSP